MVVGLGCDLVSSQFPPHSLEARVVLVGLLVGPLDLVFMLCLLEYISPVLFIELLLDFPDILIRLLQHVDSLSGILSTSALIFCISTSSSFSFTSFNRS